MKLSDLHANPKNPRIITDSKKKMLKKALIKYGDLSGVIYNRKTHQLVGGHQRKDSFDQDTPIVITKKYSKPTKTGTVAEGYFVSKGEKFSYREVYWEPIIEKAAMLAANKNAGDWDFTEVDQILKDLSSFDVDFDLDLTMFDAKELTELPNPITVSAHTRTTNQKDTKSEKKSEKKAKCKAGQVYALGTTRLRVGKDELFFCDTILDRWEKASGLKPRLLASDIMKKKLITASKQQRVTKNGHAKNKEKGNRQTV